MKKSWSLLVLGLILGMLLTVPWATSAPIQSQVGINVHRPDTNTWLALCSPFTSGDGVFDTDTGTPCTVLDVQATTYGLNGTTFDRLRTVQGILDSNAGIGLFASGQYVFNGGNATWSRRRGNDGNSDAIVTTNTHTDGYQIFNGTTWDRARSASANWRSLNAPPGITLTVNGSNWFHTNTPAANTQATVSRAAVAGVQHVATHITACSQEAALAAGVFVNLRDGASGAGTVLWTGFVQNPLNDSRCISADVANLFGTANTAMTIEFTAAGGAANRQTVTMSGFSVQ